MTQHYEIRVQGHLDLAWSDWFGGLTISYQENGETLLTGPVIDQAALHGILGRVRDLGLPLISVQSIDDEEDANQGGRGHPAP